MNRVTLLVFIFFLSYLPKIFGQNISNEGTDFWAVFPTHVASGNAGTTASNHANIAIFVTSKVKSLVTVSWAGGSKTDTVFANTAVQFDVDWASSYIAYDDQNKILSNRGIHIKVADGWPKVSAYAHIYAGYRSAASLILPFETLGQNYFSVNYAQVPNSGNNYLAIVAVEDNTKVIIHPKGGSLIPVTLTKAGDVYEYMAGFEDLTGTYVETDPETSACKRFAAFSGTSVTGIGTSVNGIDPLFQQIYPVSSLGKTYGVVPFYNQSYFYRVVATIDNTSVYQDGTLMATLNKGDYFTSQRLNQGVYITGNNNFLLSQFMYSRSNAGIDGGPMPSGDPDMVLLNSIEFNINNITVFSSDKQNIYEKFVNILIRANKASTFKINGTAPSVTWTPLQGNSSYAYAQIPVYETSLTLSADDGFNAIAYGYGNVESYAYSAGTNLASNNYLTVVNETKMEESPNGCVGQELEFKINLPYKPDKITWTLDSEPAIITENPVPQIKTTNGVTFYVYSYPQKKTYTTKGEYHLSVEAFVPNNASSCVSGNLITNYVFTIYDLPTVDFDFTETSCAKSDVVFTDKSKSNTTDFSLTNWLWDFGDGKISTDQNPTHQYTAEGNYNVTLSVKSGTGCYSDPAPFKTISIYPLPVSKFTTTSKTCINTDIVFTDQSSISSLISPNTIKNWHWDFGDGTVLDKITADPFVYQYKTPGTFTIKLTTTSNNDCVSDVFSNTIVVTNLPVADFSMPDICLRDAFALFTNKSIDAANGTGNFTYSWNYGDAANATLANPNTSTGKDGKHSFSIAGTYQVTLTITNDNDCVSTKTQDFVVNGAVEKADFIVQNENNLCSNTDVIINNTSKAFFGKITKILIYKDFLNAPEDFETILYPTGEDIHLTYPSFGTNETKLYTIRLAAYSGETCFEIKDKIITLKPVPQLEFSEIPAICQNDGSVIIDQAKETSGITGTGVYSGEGITASGKFNPKLVSIGEHVITYTFSADNGCPSVITQIAKVYKSPIADIEPVIYILAGGQTTLPASAKGDKLSYLWTPATGLDNNKILNPIASPEIDTKYTLLATTGDGCTVTTYTTIKVLQALSLPNSFSPNGDNVNDVWNIKYLDTYPNATVEVFNRNGNRVFFSNGYKVPFDGNYQNEPLPVGVYYYIINPRNGRKSVSGPLTIIR